MYKKLMGMLIIALILTVSVGAISAEDDSISIPVEIKWDDSDDLPAEVTVELIKDGKVVDTAKVTSNDSWKTTFEVDEDGDYEVNVSDLLGFSSDITGDVDKGFVIENSIIEDDVLGGVEDSDLEDSSEDENLSDAEVIIEDDITPEDENSEGNDTNESSEETDDNSTDDTNSTEDDVTNSTEDDENITTTTTTTTTTTKIVKHDKKPVNNTTVTDNKHTGFPLTVLILALFAAVFIPLARKK